MNDKIILLLIALFFTTVCASAQTISFPDQDSSKFLEKDAILSLDKSVMLATYRLEVLHDTVSPNAIKSDNTMVLQIGAKQDKYFDLYRAKSKEFLSSEENKKRDPNAVINEAMQLGKGTLTDEIYWNYPGKGVLAVTTHLLGDYYLYEESIPQIEWEMKEGTQSVAGYACQQAACRLFGRNYTVWYAPEIPVSKGPYKFSGLPGLILKVEDDSHQVSWTCIGLEKKTGEDIFFTERDYMKTEKTKFLKSFNDFKRDPVTVFQSAGRIAATPGKTNKTRAYNPIERE